MLYINIGLINKFHFQGAIIFDKVKKETVKEQYDEFAKDYDKVMITAEYPDPKKWAEAIEANGVHCNFIED